MSATARSFTGIVLSGITLFVVGVGVSTFVHGRSAAERERRGEQGALGCALAAGCCNAGTLLAMAADAGDDADPQDAREDERPARPAPSPRKLKATPPMKDLRLKDEESAEARIEEELEKLTEVHFDDTPLSEVVGYLKERHHLNIWVDRRGLEEAGVNIEHPVTLNLADVHLVSVLNLVADSLKLEWLVQDEVLKITSASRALDLAETRTYDVQNLLDAGHSSEELLEAVLTCIEPFSWMQTGEGRGTLAISGGVLICRHTQRVQDQIDLLLSDLDEIADAELDDPAKAGHPMVTLKVYRTHDYPADELAKALRQMVAVDTWGTHGIDVRTIKGALLVQQTQNVHREIEKVLKQLLPPPIIVVEPPGDKPAEAEAAHTSRSMPQARLTVPAPRARMAMRHVSRKKA